MKKPASIAAAITLGLSAFATSLPAAAERPRDVFEATSTAEAGIDATSTGSIVSAEEAEALTEAAPTVDGRPYAEIISRYAAQHGISEALVHAVVRVESNYRPGVRGRAGEIGLMQIKPATARSIGFSGSSESLHDPATNLRYGIKYLAMAQDLGDGSVCGTLLRYNAGHGARRMNPTSAAYCGKVSRFLGES